MKRIILITFCMILAISFLLGLTTFPLAAEETASSREPELVGVLITTEPLDLYEGRLYGTPVIKEGSGDTSPESFRFGDVDGYAYFFYRENEISTASYASYSDISEGHFAFHATDGGDFVEMAGTLYVAAGTGAERAYYINPVYETEDGRVFAAAGSGVLSDMDSEGSSWSTKLTSETSVTDPEGKLSRHSISVEISVAVMYRPISVAVLQMDSGSRILSRSEYTSGQMPESIVPESGCSYLLVETTAREPGGRPRTNRQICQQEDTYLRTFSCNEDHILLPVDTPILWAK